MNISLYDVLILLYYKKKRELKEGREPVRQVVTPRAELSCISKTNIGIQWSEQDKMLMKNLKLRVFSILKVILIGKLKSGTSVCTLLQSCRIRSQFDVVRSINQID